MIHIYLISIFLLCSSIYARESCVIKEVKKGGYELCTIDSSTNATYTISYLQKALVSLVIMQGYQPFSLELGISRDVDEEEFRHMVQSLGDHATGDLLPKVFAILFVPDNCNKYMEDVLTKSFISLVATEAHPFLHPKDFIKIRTYRPRALNAAGCHLPDIEVKVIKDSIQCYCVKDDGTRSCLSIPLPEGSSLTLP